MGRFYGASVFSLDPHTPAALIARFLGAGHNCVREDPAAFLFNGFSKDCQIAKGMKGRLVGIAQDRGVLEALERNACDAFHGYARLARRIAFLILFVRLREPRRSACARRATRARPP